MKTLDGCITCPLGDGSLVEDKYLYHAAIVAKLWYPTPLQTSGTVQQFDWNETKSEPGFGLCHPCLELVFYVASQTLWWNLLRLASAVTLLTGFSSIQKNWTPVIPRRGWYIPYGRRDTQTNRKTLICTVLKYLWCFFDTITFIHQDNINIVQRKQKSGALRPLSNDWEKYWKKRQLGHNRLVLVSDCESIKSIGNNCRYNSVILVEVLGCKGTCCM